MRFQALGNAQYLYMGVALVQFLKAFTPIVVTAVAALLLNDRPSKRVVMALVVLCAGTAVTAADDVALSDGRSPGPFEARTEAALVANLR